MALFTRQPFAELGTPRLQALQSAKNRQNAITPASTFSSPLKPSLTSSTGKRRASSIFDDTDAENLDPSIFNSPTKKCKTAGLSDIFKPSKFSLITSPSKQASPVAVPSPPAPSVRKALSSPTTTNSTPISTSRGSPKIHKRISAISKRRASSSPFRRVDPPSFSHNSSPALPFSIDAALSGTIPNYTPKSTTLATPAATPTHVSSVEDSMPKGWFFEIHEDTPEQEASNLMEHSASVLDISSDDDLETKQLNEERGKENIPPPDFLAAQQGARQQAADAMLDGEPATEQHVKLPRLRKITQDAMDEDRKPLGDLPTAEFYGEGCDSGSYVTVDPGLERPSGLSKEFEFDCPTPEKKKKDEVTVAVEEVVVAAEVIEPTKAEDVVEVYSEDTVSAQNEVAPVAEPVTESPEVLVAVP